MKHISAIGIVWFLTLCGLSAQIPYADSLQQVINQSSGVDKEKAMFNLAMYLKTSNTTKAYSYFEWLKTNGTNDYIVAQSIQQLGNLSFRKGDFVNARLDFEKALGLFEQLNALQLRADVYYSLGNVYAIQGNLVQAVNALLQAVRYYESVSNEASLMACYESLGNIYAQQHNFIRSIEYTQKAIKLYEESANTMQALVAYESVGKAYLQMANYNKSKEYFIKALSAYRKINNQAGVAYIYYQLGVVEQRRNKHSEAVAYFMLSNEIARTLNLNSIRIQSTNGIAGCYLAQNKLEEAKRLFSENVKLAQKAGMTVELQEAYNGLERIYQLTSQSEKATTYGSLSREIEDSLFNDSMLKKLNDLQLHFEAEKKQREIDLLSKEQLIRETELSSIRKQNRIYTFATAIVICLFVILSLLYVQNKRYAANLQKQKEDLERLNMVKDRFFSIISHDLRNNLTSMKLYFDLISNPQYKPTDQKEITTQIANSVENTIDLLENLLIWASSQIKGIPIRLQALDMDEVITKNISLLHASAAQKNIEIRYASIQNLFAFADQDMIYLVVRNLLSNAIKFTPYGGFIHLRLSQDEKGIQLEIEDNGVGISEENLKKLFHQHEHPTTKGTANEKGTGLGLLLCSDFIRKNNGTIRVISKKDAGTTFFITLPKALNV